MLKAFYGSEKALIRKIADVVLVDWFLRLDTANLDFAIRLLLFLLSLSTFYELRKGIFSMFLHIRIEYVFDPVKTINFLNYRGWLDVIEVSRRNLTFVKPVTLG